MRISKWCVVPMLAAPAALAGDTAARPTATEGFEKLKAAAKAKDPELLDVLFPSKLVESRRDWNADATKAWREGFCRVLADAKLVSAKEDGDEAMARLSSAGDESVLPLHFGGSRWIVAAAQEYQVKGRAIGRANGSSPASVHLAARTDKTDGYGDSAYSFAHVSGDMKACKNRYDVWFCWNGDLHVPRRGGGIVDLGAAALASVDVPPAGTSWSDTVPAVKGHVCVVRCMDARDRDFYVKLAVKDAGDDGVDLDWQILAMGPGAPPNVHKGNPMDPSDRSGADGCDGMCGRPGRAGTGGSGGR